MTNIRLYSTILLLLILVIIILTICIIPADVPALKTVTSTTSDFNSTTTAIVEENNRVATQVFATLTAAADPGG